MSRSRLVYSSDFGRACPDCGQPVDQCSCPRKPKREAGDGIVRVRRESKGRGGKTVTTVTGLTLDDRDLDALVAELKRSLGAGGSAKEGVIVIQGDHADALVTILEKRGCPVKRAGG